MRKFCMVIAIALVFITIFTGCTAQVQEAGNEQEYFQVANLDYDQIILDNAEMELEREAFVEEVNYKVRANGGRIYIVTIEDEQIPIEVPENPKTDEIKMSKKQISKGKCFNIFQKSKEMVKAYITSSQILKDKERLIQKITELPLYIIESMNVDSSQFGIQAFYEEGCVNVLRDSQNDVCEWMFVHEMIHYLSELTNDGKKVYEKNDFDEAMTDVITASMSPKLPEDSLSGYNYLYNDIYRYIAIWKEEAIRAYFYGYNEIWKKTSKDEFDVFVIMFHNMNCNELARYCVDFTYAKWHNKYMA